LGAAGDARFSTIGVVGLRPSGDSPWSVSGSITYNEIGIYTSLIRNSRSDAENAMLQRSISDIGHNTKLLKTDSSSTDLGRVVSYAENQGEMK